MKPGKVSKDFINGKRARYSNPFQFYISVSIIFFLILGIVDKYKEFQDFQSGRVTQANLTLVDFDDGVKDTTKSIDSIVKNSKVDSIIQSMNFEEQLVGLDSVEKLEVLKAIEQAKDSIRKGNMVIPKNLSTFTRMLQFQKENPNLTIEQALDSLNMKRTFWNRFKYTRIEKINGFQTNLDEENKRLGKELISYASISIFIFLPIFTLFLKVIYARRSFSYVEHLVFVFHTQTVFFLLSTIFFILWLVTQSTNVLAVFLPLFLIYLFIAMKKFYRQGFFKTFLKFMIINFIFMNMAALGLVIVSVIAFAIY